ncbi:MAG: type IV pilus twitching motility protein PilT [Chrysiogenales bacterium]
MNNVDKLFDALLKMNGDTLVINLSEPAYIIKNSKKNIIVKLTLNDNEFKALENEIVKVFSGQESIVIQERTIAFLKKEKWLEFSLLPEKPLNVNELLQIMVAKNASDLHLSTNCKPRVRIDGDILTLTEFHPLPEETLWQELEKITPAVNGKEFQESHDTDFAHEIEGLARFRVNIFRDFRGIGAVFRKIPTQIVSADDIGISATVLALCHLPKGLILVTGPTGSGKSTTLSAMIDYINQNQKKHIITVEDPVEFVHQNKMSLINQREIKTHTQSFKKALRAALREDPDVILVGEMRDLETIAIAIEMAVTGHLVFATLHTATAIGTVDRIIDQFPPAQQSQIRAMLADALIGVISQMLCKKKEGGRIAAYEVLIGTVGIANIIREGKTFQITTMMQTGKAIGQKLMNDSLAELVEKGLVDAVEALSKAVDLDNLKTRLKAKNLLSD